LPLPLQVRQREISVPWLRGITSVFRRALTTTVPVPSQAQHFPVPLHLGHGLIDM